MIEYLRDFNTVTVFIRLALACICGSLLGLNRERQGRAAGLRTYYIVCLGACLAMLLSQYLNLMLDTRWATLSYELGIKTDVSRFGAQVINGIGFLGAGSILLTRKNQVRGLTSAASLWTCACLGLTIGAGFIELGVVGFIFIMLSLKLLSRVDVRADRRKNRLRFGFELDDIANIAKILDFVKSEELSVVDYSYSDESGNTYLEIAIQFPRFYTDFDFMSHLSRFDFIKSVKKL